MRKAVARSIAATWSAIAVDEQHVLAGPDEGGAERAADGAGAPDQDRRPRSRPRAFDAAPASRRRRPARWPACPRRAARSSRRNCRRRDRLRTASGPSARMRSRSIIGLRWLGLDDACEARPGEVLHPGGMRGDRVDLLHLGEGLRRVPPVVELDVHVRDDRPSIRSRAHRAGWLPPWPLTSRIAPEAAAAQAVQDVADQCARRSRRAG